MNGWVNKWCYTKHVSISFLWHWVCNFTLLSSVNRGLVFVTNSRPIRFEYIARCILTAYTTNCDDASTYNSRLSTAHMSNKWHVFDVTQAIRCCACAAACRYSWRYWFSKISVKPWHWFLRTNTVILEDFSLMLRLTGRRRTGRGVDVVECIEDILNHLWILGDL